METTTIIKNLSDIKTTLDDNIGSLKSYSNNVYDKDEIDDKLDDTNRGLRFSNEYAYKNFKYQKDIMDKQTKHIGLLCKGVDDIIDKNDNIESELSEYIDRFNIRYFCNKTRIKNLKRSNNILYVLLGITLVLFIASNIFLLKRISNLEDNIDYLKSNYIQSSYYENDISELEETVEDIKIKTGANKAKLNSISSLIERYKEEYTLSETEEGAD